MEVASASNHVLSLVEEEVLIVQEMATCLQFVRIEVNIPLAREINGAYT